MQYYYYKYEAHTEHYGIPVFCFHITAKLKVISLPTAQI